MRRLALLSSFVLLNTGCAGLLGLDDFTEGDAAAGGASGSSVSGSPTASSGESTPSSSSTDGAGGGGDGGAGGTGGSGPLDVTPNGTVKVGILRSLQFAADAEVTWAVDEVDGGTIDEDGFYISPEEPGEYHVTATSEADPELSETVTLTVVGLELAVLGGIPGGPGTIDGPVTRARLNEPSGMAFLDNGDTLVVADSSNHTVRAYDRSANTVRTIAGAPLQPGAVDGTGAEAQFNHPEAVAASPTGSTVWVVDRDNHCIRRVNVATGVVTTLAGSCGEAGTVDGVTGAASRFDGLGDMALGPSRNFLYVCNVGAERAIRRVDITSGATTTVITGLNQCSLTADEWFGKVFYGDGRNERVIYDFDDDPVFDPASVAVRANLPAGVTFAGAIGTDGGYGGFLYMVSSTSQSMRRLDLDTTEFDPDPMFGSEHDYVDGPFGVAQFTGVNGIRTYGAQSSVFFSDRADTVRRVDLDDEEVETVFGLPENQAPVDGDKTTARLVVPFSVATSADGDAYVTSIVSDRGADASMRRIDAANGSISTFTGQFELDEDIVDGAADIATIGIALDIQRVGDDFYFLDWAAQTLRRVSGEDGSIDTIAGTNGLSGFVDGVGAAARFQFDLGAGLGSDGIDLYVADGGNAAIRKVELATGGVTTIAGGTRGTANGVGEEAQFLTPGDVAWDRGFLYISDAEDSVIRRMDLTSGEVTSLIGISGTSGNVDGGVGTATFQGLFRMVADGIGNLYVTSVSLDADENTGGLVRRINLDTVVASTFLGLPYQLGIGTGPLPTTVTCPAGIDIDPAGDLVFTDFCDGAIGIVRPL